MKTKQQWSGGGAHGGCFQDLEICEIKFAQGCMTWTCWDFFTIFHKFQAWCGRTQCVLPSFAETCSSTSSILITHSPPSPLSKPPPSSRLRVLFFLSRVMSIYLSIDLSVHFFSPGLLAAAVSFVCYTVAALLAATS